MPNISRKFFLGVLGFWLLSGGQRLTFEDQLTRTREDQKSRVGNQTEDGQVYKKPTMRDIWRHEAEVTSAARQK